MDLEELRSDIDRIDDEIIMLFKRRMDVAGRIAEYKRANSIPVYVPERESEKLCAITSELPDSIKPYGMELYNKIFDLSRKWQNRIQENEKSVEETVQKELSDQFQLRLACGLLGRKLGHSYSPQIHSLLGEYDYKLFEKEPEELEKFLKSGNFDGINITIPYKKTVIPYCSELSETASSIGSVNTIIRRSDGTLFGDNTDAFGFEQLLNLCDFDVSGKKAIVLGSGGASVTVCAVLKKLNASEIAVVSRTGENNYRNIEKHYNADFVINATPVGMYPENGNKLIDLGSFSHLCGVIDLIYNPFRTELLLEAERLGIPHAGGLYMLVAQAQRSSELFTGTEISNSRINDIYHTLAAQMRNIVLVGMPGCGKTMIAEKLGNLTGREVVDTDSEIVRRTGMQIPEIFEKKGEEYFRELESDVLSDVGKLSGKIISTGGGCVTRKENYPLLHQNGIILWIRREADLLPRTGRPVSLKRDINELYKEREPMYSDFADAITENNGTPEEVVSAIMEIIG